MGKENTSEPKQLSIRIPWDLRMKLKSAARSQGRSLNSEIVRRLLYTLELDNVGSQPLAVNANKLDTGYVPQESEQSELILKTLNTINQKLDYITSDSYSNASFLNLVNYLSRRL